MLRVYDKGNGRNYIAYDENQNDKCYELIKYQDNLHYLVIKNMEMVMDLHPLIEGKDFYFWTN